MHRDSLGFVQEIRPGGAEGDNLIKTRLATGEMEDVFLYNSGSLFQALNPDQTLVNLDDQPWVDHGYAITGHKTQGLTGDDFGVRPSTRAAIVAFFAVVNSVEMK